MGDGSPRVPGARDTAAASRCGVVVLAAGASRRMGQAKQLLPVGGVPLVRAVVERLLPADLQPLVVVLGAAAPEVAKALAGLPVETVVNADWAEGMGSSLRVGVAAALERDSRLTELIVVLADQPGVTAEHLGRLRAMRRETGCAVVATANGEVQMPPVLFAVEWFPRLLTLGGDAGARGLLRAAGDDLAVAVVPAGPWPDLDTPEEYAAFLRANG